MLLSFRPIYYSFFWRATYVVSTLLVFSYVLFDVLDLDGSDFPKPLAPVERAVILAEIPSNVELVRSLDRAGRWENVPVLFADRSGEHASLRQTEVLRFSPLESARAHRYRVGLPRDSVPD